MFNPPATMMAMPSDHEKEIHLFGAQLSLLSLRVSLETLWKTLGFGDESKTIAKART
jgi:hypothetical protein